MRTTLTIENDVAVLLDRIRREKDTSLKSVVNEALRRGLHEMSRSPRKSRRFRTQGFKDVTLLVPVDNVAEVIAIAEGDAYK